MIDLGLRGKTVLVTGAARGIGAAIATRFAGEGASVVVHYRSDRAGAQRVVAAIAAAGGSARAVKADITTGRAPDALIRRSGPVDVLVNNAVFQPITPLTAIGVDEWRAVMETNVTAVFRLTSAAARGMAERRTGGSIIHIASIEGTHPAAGHAHYATSKAALLMHARAAALELGTHGIRVNAVSPGLVDRDGLEREWPEGVARWCDAAPLGHLIAPGDVADACLFLASPLSRSVTGHNLVVDAGVTATSRW